MCGLTGIIDLSGRQRSDQLSETVAGMARTLDHRGPDDWGVWVDGEVGIALGHTRLSIIDLSDTGHQPMVSESGRYVLAYNGEIYNYRQVGRPLAAAGHVFRGHSDTEVLLAAIEAKGLDRVLPELNGMFAFALWDRQERRLTLSRDRLGEKPLYYGTSGGTFLFGSELVALRAHPAFVGRIDRDVLALFFRHNCVPAPHCIYDGFYKLPPGTTVVVDLRRGGDGRQVPEPSEPVSYWSARDVAQAGAAHPFTGPADELVSELDRLLLDAVGIRMQADVPLGAFLSGGIDSSTVVALMQAQTMDKVRTFTIGFDDPAYDESGFAGRVARHLGTDHLALTVTPDDVAAAIPRLPSLYDEPFADSSQLPTFLVSRLARGHVTVSLSGDGGDELFAGYNRYTWCPRIWRGIRGIPRPARVMGAAALGRLSPQQWDAAFGWAHGALPSRLRVRNPGQKVQKLGTVLAAEGLEEMYQRLVSQWANPTELVLGASALPWPGTAGPWESNLSDPVATMMYRDLVTYLPDDILVKLDRASMGVSLESRVPMLDHRVVDFAWHVPMPMKVKDGQGKWLLRQLLLRYVPLELVERPKAGFGLPVGAWLRGPLRSWAEDLLDPVVIKNDGLLDPRVVQSVWAAHLSGRGDYQDQLWGVLMFQAWRAETPTSRVEFPRNGPRLGC